MTGDRIYRKTQIAWPTIVPLVVVAAVLVVVFARVELSIGPWIVGGVYGVILLLFATLTVTVTSDGVLASFGIGLVHKAVPFAEVASFARVRNRWIDGWGIHGYPGGILYNASGLSAVEFRLSSGRSVAIGTAEPAALAAAIAQATGQKEGAHDARAARSWGMQHTAGLVIGAIAVVFAGFAVYVTLQPPTVIPGFDSVYVSNGLYRNTIAYTSMQSLTLENQLPRVGLKINGSGVGTVMRGNYRVDGWGASRLYVNLDAPPFVVIQTADTHIAVNFKDPARTRRLYEDLKARAAERRK